MKTTLINIIHKVCDTLVVVCKAVTQVVAYLTLLRNDKKEKDFDEAHEKADKKIEEACDNGSLEDLLNATDEKGKANELL